MLQFVDDNMMGGRRKKEGKVMMFPDSILDCMMTTMCTEDAPGLH